MAPMRYSLFTLLVTAAPLFAQPPQAAPPLNPNADPLPALLSRWEEKMKGIKAIEATVKRTTTDAVTHTQEVYEGSAKLLRPDRADLYLKKVDNAQVYERFLLTGTFLYQFQPTQKLVRVHQLPQRAPGQPAIDDNFLGLLFGMSAVEAQRRYELRLVPKPGDVWWYYISVKPRLASDRAEFAEARLVLSQSTLLPRQIEFVDPAGNPIKWEIPKIDTNPRLGPTDFQRPQLPKDWQIKQEPPPPAYAPGAPGGPPPTKVRPSGNP
jgi:TIGR03009 family protein